MRTVVARMTGLLAPVLVLGGCASGGGPAPAASLGTSASSPAPSGRTLDDPRASSTLDPAGVVAAARDATQRAASVVATRTTRDGDDWIHEDIEVAFTVPPSARVLHVGEDIWTLDVVEGVGYLKDQSDQKSTIRWSRLSEVDTAAHLGHVTPAGLLGVLDAATSVAPPTRETVRGVPATCHAFVLDPATALVADRADEEGSTSTAPRTQATARLCVDSGSRPVESVVTIDDRVTTTVFSQWGFALEAMPPPASLVDEPGG